MIENKQEKGLIAHSADIAKMAVNKKPLSFSISRILEGTTDSKPASVIEKQSRDIEEPRVPMHFGTIHHYGSHYPMYGQNNYDYAHFESTVRPRACSTPENDEYPSPTPTIYHPRHLAYHHPVSSLATPHCESPSELLYKPAHGEEFKVNFGQVDEPAEKSLDSLGESYQQSPSPMKLKSKKKTRTVFSRSQVYQLESAFEMKRYLSSAERSGLAAQLKLSETQIKIWFQNRRNKWKRQINGEMDEIPVPSQFAAGFLTSPYCTPSLTAPSLTAYGRDEFMRGTIAPAPTYYSHPYAQESRLRSSLI